MPRNSVGTAQVINGSLQKVDLSKKAATALRGNRGARGPAGQRGPTGVQGIQGIQGIQGVQGPAGTALAYATLLATGTIATTAGTTPKNVSDANITHPATGIYCFGGLSFAPETALVSVGNNSVTTAAMATVGVDGRLPTPNLTDCTVGVSRVRVRIYAAASGALVDAPFTIWFQ